MSTSDVVTIALIVLVPAALLWAVFIARTGRPGAPPKVKLGIPQALRPGQPDEALEGPRLERLQVWGLLTSVALAAFVPLYWLPEAQRQEAFQERFDHEAEERGALIFAAAPPLDEDVSAAEFKEEEKAISLGQACANCHGGDGSGGLANPAHRTEAGDTVAYAAPPLNNVFQRWDEEVIRFTIERGRPGTPMPAWAVEFGGSMTTQMVTDVIAWLKTLPGNQDPPPPISDACQEPSESQFLSCGQEIFEARCVVCHGEQGQGKEAAGTAPALDVNNSGPDEAFDPWLQGMALWQGDVRHLSLDQHLFTVRNGRRFAFMPPFAEAPAAGIPVPPYPLTDEQIQAVVAYERTL